MTKITSFSLPLQLMQKLQTQIESTGLSRSDIIRRALDLYFKSLEKEENSNN